MADAKVLIGYLDVGEAQHVAAERLLLATVDEEIAINPITLAEVLVGPTRAGRMEAASSVLQQLGVVELTLPSDAAVRLARLRAGTGLRMPDCCVLLSAHVTGASVASFDDRLVQEAVRQGLTVVDPPGKVSHGWVN